MKPDGPDDRLDPDEVAATTESLRALAHSVLRDGAAAEDVAQQAWLAALEGRRPAHVPLRWWLRGVARNLALKFARGESRRRARERAVARPDRGGADPSSAAARAEAHRRVVGAVLALDEPYRTTMLLRWVDGVEPSEIAQRLGEKPGTVRTRLQRGLELLRGRLDREAKGDRRTWAVALVPLLHWARGPVGGATAAGSVATKSAATAAAIAATLLLAVGSVAVWMAASGGGPESADVAQDDPVARHVAPERARPSAPDAPAADAAAPANEGAALRVIVRDARGAALPGARVDLFDRPPPSIFESIETPPRREATATSDAEGIAVLGGLAPGQDRTLVATARGHAVATHSVGTPGEGASIDVTLLLADACRLTGRTVAPDGSPVAGATVQVGRGWPWRAVSGDDGRFVMDDLPWGTHEIRAARARMTPLAVAEVRVPLDGELTLVLRPAATLSGVVRDRATGLPIAGAEVTAGIWWGMRGGGRATSDADGRYVIDTLPDGVVNQLDGRLRGWRQVPRAPGPTALQIGVRSGATTEHDVELFRAVTADGRPADARIEGTVRGPAGPVAGVRVVARGLGGPRTADTGADGRFAFDELVEGRWMLSAEASAVGLLDAAMARAQDTRDTSAVTVQVGAAEAVTHDIELTAGATVTGRVVDPAGRAVAGARFANAITDADGTFVLRGLLPGRREVAWVEAPRHVRTTQPYEAPGDGETAHVDVTLEAFARVTGFVRTGDGGAPPPGLQARVVASTGRVLPGPTGAPDVRTSEAAVVDATGAYAADLTWTTSGRFVVEVCGPGLPTSRSREVPVEGGRAEYAVDLVLDEGRRIEGRVVDDVSGDAVTDATVAVGSFRAGRVDGVTSADGTFSVLAVSRDVQRASLQVEAPGHVARALSVEFDDPTPLVIRLRRALSIAGRVIGDDGGPVAGVSVAYGAQQCVTDQRGEFALDGLPPDPTSLEVAPASASGPDVQTCVVEDVVPGTTDLVIRVRAGLRIAGRVVVPGGAGATDVAVTARADGSADGGGTRTFFARTSSDGTFTLIGLAPGTYTLDARPNRDSPYAGDSADCFPARARGVAAGTTELVMELSRGESIRGVVVDASGRPVGGIWLEAGGRTTRSEPDGKFALDGLRPGTYLIRTVPSSAPDGPASVSGGENVAAGTDGVRLVAAAGKGLEGRVRRADGTGVAGATVSVTGPAGLRRRATTDAEGRFSVPNLPDVRFDVVAEAAGMVPAHAADAVPGRQLAFTLVAGRVAEGRLLDAHGAPIAGTWIEFNVDGEPHLRRAVRTDDAGRFRVDGLADREYRATATLRVGDEVVRAPVGNVRAGSTDVDLRAGE